MNKKVNFESCSDEDIKVKRGEALLIPAKSCSSVIIKEGMFLDYYQL